MNHPKRTFQKPMSLELHDFGCRENRDSTSHFIAISEEKSTFLFYTYIKSPLISWKIWRSICIIALWDESSCIPSFRAKLRQINGEETHRATIDCVSTMAANEAKWVKQIIIRGLMCVTVKFDTIIHITKCAWTIFRFTCISTTMTWRNFIEKLCIREFSYQWAKFQMDFY